MFAVTSLCIDTFRTHILLACSLKWQWYSWRSGYADSALLANVPEQWSTGSMCNIDKIIRTWNKGNRTCYLGLNVEWCGAKIWFIKQTESSVILLTSVSSSHSDMGHFDFCFLRWNFQINQAYEFVLLSDIFSLVYILFRGLYRYFEGFT